MTKLKTHETRRRVSAEASNSISAVAMASSRCCSLMLGRSSRIRAPSQKRAGQTLVPIIIIQFVINCFLALILNQQHQTTSQAIPIEATLERHDTPSSGTHAQHRHHYQSDHLRSATGHGGDQRRSDRTLASLALHGSLSSESLYDESTSSELDRASANLHRPRWRLIPAAVSGATSARLLPERPRNRVLTIEDDEDETRDTHEDKHNRLGNNEGPISDERETETRLSIGSSRARRHQQQQAPGDNLNEHQRQQIKTRMSIQRAEQAYRDKLMEIKQRYLTNRAITDKAYYILLTIYAILITFGTISNSLICLTVIFKPKILSPRNIFIVNLAGSDLLLCVFTMPLTFIEVSMKIWQMGLIPCKLVAGLQATSIFVSTISITAIALDRYKVIVYPTHQETASGTRGALLLLASVWIGALSLSLPLFTYRTVEHHEITSPQIQSDSFQVRSSSGATAGAVGQAPQAAFTPATMKYHNGSDGGTTITPSVSSQTSAPFASTGAPLVVTSASTSSSIKQYPNQLVDSFDFCIEAWPFAHGRGIFSVISMILQYVLPITIVSFVYTKISRKLQKRLIRRQRLTQLECQQKRQLNLIKRTHTMLVSVSLVFGLSWLPLNLVNVAGDFSPEFRQLFDDQTFRIIFAICHLIGCSSACSNPILYGFLNENFRKEFHQVYNHHARIMMRRLRRLAELLNCCWLTRKVFQLCFGSRIDLRGVDEDEDEDHDEGEGEEKSYVEGGRSDQLGRVRDHRQANGRKYSNNSSSFAYRDDNDFSSSLASNNLTNGDNSSLASDFTSGSSLAAGSWSGGSSNGAWRKSAASHLSSLNVIPLNSLNVNNDNQRDDDNKDDNERSDRSNRHSGGDGQLQAPGHSYRQSVNSNTSQLLTNSQQQQLRPASPQANIRLTMMTDETQNDELANFQKTTDEADKRRRLSYQTVTSISGRHTFGGRTMRLCLCISSSSSAETLGGMAPTSVATPNGLEQAPTTTTPTHASGPAQLANSASLEVIINDGTGRVGERQAKSAESVGQRNVQQAASDGEGEDERRRRRQHRRRRRQRMRQRLVQLECECQCHKPTSELGGPDRMTLKAGGDTRDSPGQTTTIGGGPAQCQTTFTGRRVWLRFLGADSEGDGQPPPPYSSSTIGGDNDPSSGSIVPRGSSSTGHQNRQDRPAAAAAAAAATIPLPPTQMLTDSGPGLKLAERSDRSQVLHKSQPDLAMSWPAVEHRHKSRASCDATIELENNKQTPANERNRSSGAEAGISSNPDSATATAATTTTTTSVAQIFERRQQQQHCNNCKHSSVLTSARLAAGSNQRRLNGKHQRHQRHRATQHRRPSPRRPGGSTKSDEIAVGVNLKGTSKQRATTGSTVRLAAPPVDEVPAQKKRPLSISSWMTSLRRRKSASSNQEASQPSSSSSRRNSNQLSRQRSGGKQEPPTVMVASATSKSSAATPPLQTSNSSPKQSSSLSSSRNNSQQAQHQPGTTTTGKNSGRLAFASGGANAKQVGTVYLSIEMADRKRADSVFSFDGGHEKSTSVVVMLADEEDDVDELNERGRRLGTTAEKMPAISSPMADQNQEQARANSELARGDGGVYKGAKSSDTTTIGASTKAAHCHGGAFNSNQRQTNESAETDGRHSCGGGCGGGGGSNLACANHRPTTIPIEANKRNAKFNNGPNDGNQINIESDYSKDPNEAKHTSRCHAQQQQQQQQTTTSPQQAKTSFNGARGTFNDEPTKLSTTTMATTAIGPEDNFIDCCPASERHKRTGGLVDSEDTSPKSNNNHRRGQLPAPLGPLPSQGRDDMRPDPNREQQQHHHHTRSGPNTTTTTPTTTTIAQTIDSSGSSGSVSISGSPSAYSFTSACLLNHSSSVSSCTCSLTASSFSSGQLNATTSAATTTTTTTTTNTTTNHESSMSTSAPATHHHSLHRHQHHLGVAPGGGGPHQRTASINLSSPSSGQDTTTTTTNMLSSVACRHNELTLDESLVKQDHQLVGGPTNPVKRHRNQHQLQLRQLRTHSATLGCELGRSAKAAAAGAALAAARQRSAKLDCAGALPVGASGHHHQRQLMQEAPLKSQTTSACSRSLATLTHAATTGTDNSCSMATSIMAPNSADDQPDAADCSKWQPTGHADGAHQMATNRASLLLSSSQSAQMAMVAGTNWDQPPDWSKTATVNTAVSSSSLFSAATNVGATNSNNNNLDENNNNNNLAASNNTVSQVSLASSAGELAKIEGELMMMTNVTTNSGKEAPDGHWVEERGVRVELVQEADEELVKMEESTGS